MVVECDLREKVRVTVLAIRVLRALNEMLLEGSRVHKHLSHGHLHLGYTGCGYTGTYLLALVAPIVPRRREVVVAHTSTHRQMRVAILTVRVTFALHVVLFQGYRAAEHLGRG